MPRLFITHRHKSVFRNSIRKFQQTNTLKAIIVCTYTVDVEYCRQFIKECKVQAPLFVLYGSHQHKKNIQKAKKGKRLYLYLASQGHGRQHAKCMILIGTSALQLTISTCNFSDHKRSQNAFFKCLLPLKSSVRKPTRFQSRLISFFDAFPDRVLDQLTLDLQQYTLDSVQSYLKRARFKSIPFNVQLITSTPPKGQAFKSTGIGQLNDVQLPVTKLVTVQSTSIGAHLDDNFFSVLKTCLGIGEGSRMRIVIPKLLLYSKIMRDRLSEFPDSILDKIKPLVWKDKRLNTNDPYTKVPNVAHLKLMYGSNRHRTRVKWLLMTSMSLSIGACGRFVCPLNLNAVHTYQTCKCKNNDDTCERVFAAKNYELGILIITDNKEEQTQLAKLVPYH